MRHDPGQFGETEEPLAGEIADVGHAAEGQEMVLADGRERNAPSEDELVVPFVVGKGGGLEGLWSE